MLIAAFPTCRCLTLGQLPTLSPATELFALCHDILRINRLPTQRHHQVQLHRQLHMPGIASLVQLLHSEPASTHT